MFRLGVLPGDGIGPEIVSAARRAIAASRADAEFVELPVGWEAYEKYGSTVPEKTLEVLEDCDGWLLGPVLAGEYPEDDPANQNPSSTLRSEFDLYANVRPIRAYKDLGPKGMNLTIFRQNTEGFLADRNMHIGDGRFMPTEDTALSVRVVTRKESRRIAEAGFAYADARGEDVTAVHKGNVLKHGDGLFLEECRAVADDYPDVTLESAIVDAFAMELVRNPTNHDVVVTTNLFGDILSDEAAGVVGSLGVAPGLNHGTDHAMAQASHGAAPDIAGEDVANPAAMILSAAMLLEWIETNDRATVGDAPEAIETAVTDVIDSGIRTPDLGGDETTETFTNAVIDRITSYSNWGGESNLEG